MQSVSLHVCNGAKCSACVSYRDSLRGQYNRWKEIKNDKSPPRTNPRSHANYRYCNTFQLHKRASNLKSSLDTAESKVRYLQKKLEQSVDVCGVSVDDELHSELVSTMSDKKGGIERTFKKGSFQRLFWEQQFRNTQASASKGFRWHPMMIRWCLHLKLISTAAYHAMRSAGFITLPSRTLRDYSRWNQSGLGVQPSVTQQLMDEVKLDKLDEWKKHVCVAFDEVKIKEGIVYDKHNCKVVGFVSLGSVNDSLAELERSFNDNPSEVPDLEVAKYMLVFMVRGIFFPVDFPYAQYATTGAT